MVDLYASWARVYDYFYPDRSAEVDYWTRLAASSGVRILDLMCGTAEVSLGLSRRNHRVLGVDLSPVMLRLGSQRKEATASHTARNLSLTQGSALAIPAPDAAFDLAMVSGNGSFNHLERTCALAALRELRRILCPGGVLGLELVNPFLLEEVHPERTIKPARSVPPGIWTEMHITHRYDSAAGLVQIRQVARFEVDDEYGEATECFALHVWEPGDCMELLAAAGFRRPRFYGDYDLTPFDRWSADLLVVATVSE
jgi:ubiquinone/menaquinone biosynthesis C-methylase UbiE